MPRCQNSRMVRGQVSIFGHLRAESPRRFREFGRPATGRRIARQVRLPHPRRGDGGVRGLDMGKQPSKKQTALVLRSSCCRVSGFSGCFGRRRSKTGADDLWVLPNLFTMKLGGTGVGMKIGSMTCPCVAPKAMSVFAAFAASWKLTRFNICHTPSFWSDAGLFRSRVFYGYSSSTVIPGGPITSSMRAARAGCSGTMLSRRPGEPCSLA